jgi:hypothetical protein
MIPTTPSPIRNMTSIPPPCANAPILPLSEAGNLVDNFSEGHDGDQNTKGGGLHSVGVAQPRGRPRDQDPPDGLSKSGPLPTPPHKAPDEAPAEAHGQGIGGGSWTSASGLPCVDSEHAAKATGCLVLLGLAAGPFGHKRMRFAPGDTSGTPPPGPSHVAPTEQQQNP